MHAVFAEDVLTAKEKFLVRQYELHWDTQKIHKDSLVHTETSTKVSVESAQLLTYITTVNHVDGSWGGSAEAFIVESKGVSS